MSHIGTTPEKNWGSKFFSSYSHGIVLNSKIIICKLQFGKTKAQILMRIL